MRRFRFHDGIVRCSIYIILPFRSTFFSYCTRLLWCGGRYTRRHTRSNRFLGLYILRDIFFHIRRIFNVGQITFLQELQFVRQKNFYKIVSILFSIGTLKVLIFSKVNFYSLTLDGAGIRCRVCTLPDC